MIGGLKLNRGGSGSGRPEGRVSGGKDVHSVWGEEGERAGKKEHKLNKAKRTGSSEGFLTLIYLRRPKKGSTGLDRRYCKAGVKK